MEIDDKTVNPHEAIFRSQATCCYCKDKSFVFNFYKNSRCCGVGEAFNVTFDIVKDGDEIKQQAECPDFKLLTKIDNFTKGDGNTWIFHISKA